MSFNLITQQKTAINYSPFDKWLWWRMQSSSLPLPSDRRHRFLHWLPRAVAGPAHHRLGTKRSAVIGQSCSELSHSIPPPPSPPPTQPLGEQPWGSPSPLSRMRSPWSAWKCTTCCGGRCPGERPRRRPPGSQCKPPTRWSSSPRLCGQAPPHPPRQEGRPAAAAARPGSSPPPGTSAGCRAGGGSRCLPAAWPSPWRGARAACSTRCWGVWWRRGCAQRCGGWRWRRSPRGHRAAVTRSSPAAAWWCHGTRDTAGPSGWSSSAAGTPSSTYACSPAAWAAGAGCSSWNKSGTPAGSPGTASPWCLAQWGSGHSAPQPPSAASSQEGWGKRRETSSPTAPEENRETWISWLLTGTWGNKSLATNTGVASQTVRTRADFVRWQEKQICNP